MKILDEPSQIEITMLYVSICMGFGGMARYLIKKLTFGDVRIPYSSVLIVVGIVLGLISLMTDSLSSVAIFIIRIGAYDVVAIVFPPFVFKTAFQVDIHIFFKSFGQILIISTLGFTFTFLTNGFFLTYITGDRWTPIGAILFGLIISMIDTKDTLKFLGKFKNLGILLAGEEMLTSAISMFVYDLVVRFDYGPTEGGPVTIVLFKLGIPILLGLIIGKIFVNCISWDRCDFYTNISLSLFVSYALIYSTRIFLGSSGILSLMVFGVIVCCNKRQIATELEDSLATFWELLYTLTNFIFYIEAGILFVYATQLEGEGSDVVHVFLTYLICLLMRCAMLLILSPVLSRIGYGLSWKSGMVLVWGALKGTATLLLAFCVYLDSNVAGQMSHKLFIYSVGLVLLQLLINGTTLKRTVKFLGFTTVSVLKISNMNNVILHVMTARDRSINMLKLNRLYADAGWDAVRSATKITHPYVDQFKQEVDYSEFEERGLAYTKCPDCKKEVPVEPTPKEFQELKKEASLRILKAKKVSYWRQFEWGLLTKEANRTLVGAVDDALEKNTNVMDIETLRNIWKPRGFIVYVRNKFVKMLPKEQSRAEIRTPIKRWQLGFYKIVDTLWWEYSIFLIVFLVACSIILDAIFHSTTFAAVDINTERLALILFSVILLIILYTHSTIKLLGVGFYNYFRSPWHLIDVITLVISSFYTFYAIRLFVINEESIVLLMILSVLRCVYFLRLARIYHVIRLSIPKLVEYLDKKLDVQLALGYDVGKGFVTGESEVLKLLPTFVADEKILGEMRTKMEADRLIIMKEIGMLQRNRPTIAITVKTREAMAAVLHVMKETATALKDGGLLDDEEYQLVYKAIEERQTIIFKRYLTISPSPPDVLLKQISWLIDDAEAANFLIKHSLTVNLNYEEILIKAGDEPQGIYIIVSGLLRMTYSPNPKKLDDLMDHGALPNVDYPTTINYRESQQDYIVSGNVVGEIGILTGRTYDVNMICDGSVQAYFVSIDVMKHVIKSQSSSYNGLEQRIWKAIAVRLACIILSGVQSYQYWTMEKIQIHLERAFVPRLGGAEQLHLGDVMEAVLMIEGKAFDVINKDIYVSPCYIPRTVRKLSFIFEDTNLKLSVEPIFLIVPAEGIDELELMDCIEEGTDFTNLSATRCKRHRMMKRGEALVKPFKKSRKATPRLAKEKAFSDNGKGQGSSVHRSEDEAKLSHAMSKLDFGKKYMKGIESVENLKFEDDFYDGVGQGKKGQKEAYTLSYFNYRSLFEVGSSTEDEEEEEEGRGREKEERKKEESKPKDSSASSQPLAAEPSKKTSKKDKSRPKERFQIKKAIQRMYKKREEAKVAEPDPYEWKPKREGKDDQFLEDLGYDDDDDDDDDFDDIDNEKKDEKKWPPGREFSR